MQRQLDVEVTVIGVPNPNDGSAEDRDEFIAKMSTQVPHILDDPGAIWAEYGVVSQPSMVFVEADGTQDRHTGALGPQRLLDRIEALQSP